MNCWGLRQAAVSLPVSAKTAALLSEGLQEEDGPGVRSMLTESQTLSSPVPALRVPPEEPGFQLSRGRLQLLARLLDTYASPEYRWAVLVLRGLLMATMIHQSLPCSSGESEGSISIGTSTGATGDRSGYRCKVWQDVRPRPILASSIRKLAQ
ncbi:hypothetical protein CGLO_14515 [Colletotrichum gloeosporioides Cg-14]|uniref:Uncharacterized protein n=1 Tax=Colletotrichum gloeosporioides (strain Cg-14) TaxID=1237896 RepID=T0JU58_COLGC|nr:hypothetical protein CGLO_14515 [Colletotrichum gloeosporioides Cg-14]